MDDPSKSQEIRLGLYSQTSALLMIDKKERRLMKELLFVTLKSQGSRDWIIKKLGPEYIEVAESLLRNMGGEPPNL